MVYGVCLVCVISYNKQLCVLNIEIIGFSSCICLLTNENKNIN